MLVDRVPVRPTAPTERAIQLDLTDLDAVVDALEVRHAVVHLAGLADEAPFADLLDSNVLGTYHVLEAARRHGVRRVVLASSNRVTGFYPVGQVVDPDTPVSAYVFYGVSKVAVEALGRLYADKFGLSVVCLRIGSFEDEPTEARYLATWLSPRDGVGFIRAAITVPDVHFVTAYAVGKHPRLLGHRCRSATGYLPLDDAERQALPVPLQMLSAPHRIPGRRQPGILPAARHGTSFAVLNAPMCAPWPCVPRRVRPGQRGAASGGGAVPNAVRKRSRKASIGQTGACGPGCSPSCQPQPEIRSSTAGSRATMVIGTSWLAPSPVTTGAGWWSPRKTSTRLSSPYVCTYEMRRVQRVLDGLAVRGAHPGGVAPRRSRPVAGLGGSA